jgi:hypothetical protein
MYSKNIEGEHLAAGYLRLLSDIRRNVLVLLRGVRSQIRPVAFTGKQLVYIAKHVASCLISPLRRSLLAIQYLYRYWLLSSTRRRAAQRAAQQHSTVVKMREQEMADSYDVEDTEPEVVEPRFERNGRAMALAAAAELHFGKLSNCDANDTVVHRFMSRHDLVEKGSVRFTDKLKLVRRAKTFYFTTVESDLVHNYVKRNNINAKRDKQSSLQGNFRRWFFDTTSDGGGKTQ